MKNLRVPEDYIYDLWINKKLPSKLYTIDGKEIEIVDPGIRNIDYAGPDFHNSRIRIGNIIFNGDVEIDNFSSDWKAHGHHLNSRYTKTILHIVLKNNSNHNHSTDVNGRFIPIVELNQFLDENMRKELESKTDDENEVLMPCLQVNHKMNVNDKLKYLRQLGLQRYKKKCLRVLDRLKEIVVLKEYKISEPKINHSFYKEIKERKFYSKEFNDNSLWQQILYEEILEALGYTKNKEIMLKLARSIEYDFITKIERDNFIAKAESMLFNISGLIPDFSKIQDEETLEYVRKLVSDWDTIKQNYSNSYFSYNNWHFFKLRPQNFPTVRLAAAARYLYKIIRQNLFGVLVNNFIKTKDRKKLISFLWDNLIIQADGYWANHYNFSKKVRTPIRYFVGLSRVDEIITNCILPILSIYFEIFDKRTETNKVLDLFVNYSQKESNNLVDKVSQNLNLSEYRFKSVNYQGMLELFRGYCIKGKCLECEIGKNVFN